MRRAMLLRVLGFIWVSLALMSQSSYAADEVGAAGKAWSPSEAAPSTRYVPWNGSFNRSIPIVTPSFRGLEPRLSLDYDSSGIASGITQPNGNMGIGWSLSGVSFIERVSGSTSVAITSGRGSPAYGSPSALPTDQYVLDGNELIRCGLLGVTSAPSCSFGTPAGGVAYATRVESYLRVVAFVDANQVITSWQVASKDGVVRTYASFGDTTKFRWYIDSVKDVYGNEVKYTWTQVSGLHRVISQIALYNQPGAASGTITGSVQFFYDNRPHAYTYAAGTSAIVSTASRLRAIRVFNGPVAEANAFRGYQLTYASGTTTSASRLTQVQEFGKGSTYAPSTYTFAQAAGAAGELLPPYQMTYQEQTGAAAGPTFTAQTWFSDANLQSASRPHVTGDFNGDGFKPDFYITPFLEGGSCKSIMVLNNGSTLVPQQPMTHTVATDCPASNPPLYGPSADYLGGSRDYIVRHTYTGQPINFGGYNNGQIRILRWDPGSNTLIIDRTVSAPVTAAGVASPQATFDGGIVLAADFSGDGRADLATVNQKLWSDNGTTFSSSLWGAFSNDNLSNYYGTNQLQTQYADINGDGKMDIISGISNGTDFISYNIYLSTGASFVSGGNGLISGSWGVDTLGFGRATMLSADANGDGKSDLVLVEIASNGGYRIRTFLSLGKTISNTPSVDYTTTGLSAPQLFNSSAANANKYVFVGNFDGDNFADLLLHGATLPAAPAAPYTGMGGFKAYQILRGTAAGFVANGPLVRPITPNTNSLFSSENVADYTGDDLTDFFDNSDGVNFLRNAGPKADLMASFKTPLGGTTAVTYRQSTGTSGTRLPFNMWLVDTTTDSSNVPIAGGAVVNATTSYFYSDGKWSPTNRQFLGFGSITRVNPPNFQFPSASLETYGSKTITQYQQSIECAGQIASEQVRDGNTNALKSYVTNTFSVTSTVPYRCYQANSVKELYNEAGNTSVISRVATDYGTPSTNHFANLIREIDYGKVDANWNPLDTTNVRYVNNFYKTNATATAFLSCPNGQLVNAADAAYSTLNPSTATTYLARTLGYFDGSTTWSTPPNKCALTRQQSFAKVNGVETASTVDMSYTSFGNLFQVTDPNGNYTQYSYDNSNMLLSQVRPMRFWSDNSFRTNIYYDDNKCQTPTTIDDANGQLTTRSYDSYCRLKTETRPSAGNTDTTSFAYNVTALVGGPTTQYVQRTDAAFGSAASTYVSRTYFDGFGRTWLSETPGSASGTVKVQTDYHPRGSVFRVSVPFAGNSSASSWTTTAVDHLERPSTIYNPDGSKRAYNYFIGTQAAGDRDYSIAELTDEANTGFNGGIGTTRTYNTRIAQDSRGEIVKRSKIGAATLVTQYIRDQMQRIVQVKDPMLNQWTYTYDELGRRKIVQDPDLGQWSYAYDLGSRLTTQTDARGTTVSLSYDTMNRLTTKSVSGPAGTEVTTNTYDEFRSGFFNRSFLTTSRRTVGGTTVAERWFDYDLRGRLSRDTHKAVNGADRTLTYEYWANGALKRKQLPDGQWTGDHTYDLAGRLAAIDNLNTTSGTEPDKFVVGVTYNLRGQPLTMTYDGGRTTSYSYDAARGWVNAVTVNQGASNLSTSTYTRRANGMITALNVTDAAGVRNKAYAYDSYDRLASVTVGGVTTSYAYDNADNMIYNSALCAANPNMVYPAAGPTAVRPHAPTSICGQAVTYDANGNTLSYDPDGPGAISPRSFTYDGENRPISITAQGTTSTFAYGPDGERVRKQNGSSTTFFVGNDASLVVAPATPSGQWTSFIASSVKREGSTTSILAQDAQGSIRVSFAAIGIGGATQSHDYGAYGQPVTTGGVTTASPRGYINERFDPETGLQYLHARYLDPALGRFLTPDWWDPSNPGVDINRYAYCGGDPINCRDPSGHDGETNRPGAGGTGSTFNSTSYSYKGSGLSNTVSGAIDNYVRDNTPQKYSYSNLFGDFDVYKYKDKQYRIGTGPFPKFGVPERPKVTVLRRPSVTMSFTIVISPKRTGPIPNVVIITAVASATNYSSVPVLMSGNVPGGDTQVEFYLQPGETVDAKNPKNGVTDPDLFDFDFNGKLDPFTGGSPFDKMYDTLFGEKVPSDFFHVNFHDSPIPGRTPYHEFDLKY
jgi:RHS repeat-associated protein